MKKTGVLLHISSLPNGYSIGSFGKSAYKFVDLLAELGFNLWQVLPLCPTDDENSPYNSPAQSKINPRFIDLEALYENGVITKEQLESQKSENLNKVDYIFSESRLDLLFGLNIDLQEMAKKQWFALKDYANDKGIEIIGDFPFYLSRLSLIVKKHPDFFNLDTQGGAPPDYFAQNGQCWGAPTYNWQAEGILPWWAKRMRKELTLFDYLRMDHFRGLVEYWEIPASAIDGRDGQWQNGRPYDWFEAIKKEVDTSHLIAEDLGSWTQALEDFLKFTGIPNMKVLQFGFDGDPMNSHLPQNVPENCIYYSGTHDNDTLVGFCDSVFKNYPPVPLAKEYMHQMFSSRAQKVMLQMQDLLFLGSEARMNIPGQLNAWTFRLENDYMEKIDKDFFKELNNEGHN